MLTPPPGSTFFSISTVSLQGQLSIRVSAICQKNTNTKRKKTQCNGEPSALPPSQSRSPKTMFFDLFKDLIPRINPHSSKLIQASDSCGLKGITKK